MDHAAPAGSPANLDPRVPLAAERTLLAWVRTGLALMGFGFVVARFGFFMRELGLAHPEAPPAGGIEGSPAVSMWSGTALVFCGVASLVLAAAGHVRYMRRLRAGRPPETIGGLAGVALAGALALLGLAMAVYLVAGT